MSCEPMTPSVAALEEERCGGDNEALTSPCNKRYHCLSEITELSRTVRSVRIKGSGVLSPENRGVTFIQV